MSKDEELINNTAHDQQQAAGAAMQTEAEVGAAVVPPASEQTYQEQLAQAQALAAEYLDNWRRVTAEFSNARKRMQREQEEYKILAAARILEKLVPIVDDVERAFAALPADLATAEWVNGFRLIQRKLQALLESEGVVPIPAVGQKFDPALHHAVSYEEAAGHEEGQIISELARGYKLNDKVLRPSMVRVAKAQAG